MHPTANFLQIYLILSKIGRSSVSKPLVFLWLATFPLLIFSRKLCVQLSFFPAHLFMRGYMLSLCVSIDISFDKAPCSFYAFAVSLDTQQVCFIFIRFVCPRRIFAVMFFRFSMHFRSDLGNNFFSTTWFLGLI